jgi:hypothetical protein
MTSWGDRPSWLLGLLTLAGIGVTLAADLRRRGAFAVQSWPLAEVQERTVAAATLVLLTASTVETLHLHLRLGSLLWLARWAPSAGERGSGCRPSRASGHGACLAATAVSPSAAPCSCAPP